MYQDVTYDLDLNNETALLNELNQGKEICISYDIRKLKEVTVSVGQGGRHGDSAGLSWYADLYFKNDLRNNKCKEFDTKEDAIACAMAWIRVYR